MAAGSVLSNPAHSETKGKSDWFIHSPLFLTVMGGLLPDATYEQTIRVERKRCVRLLTMTPPRYTGHSCKSRDHVFSYRLRTVVSVMFSAARRVECGEVE